MAIYLHQDHPLAQQQKVTEADLKSLRQLRLNTWIERSPVPAGKIWLAQSYLLLLEMAEQGFGWSILPRWLTQQFGHQKLRELPVPGWPQNIQVDVVWSRRTPPGPAGRWMIDQLLAQPPGYSRLAISAKLAFSSRARSCGASSISSPRLPPET